jgi:hypothetical protein
MEDLLVKVIDLTAEQVVVLLHDATRNLPSPADPTLMQMLAYALRTDAWVHIELDEGRISEVALHDGA